MSFVFRETPRDFWLKGVRAEQRRTQLLAVTVLELQPCRELRGEGRREARRCPAGCRRVGMGAIGLLCLAPWGSGPQRSLLCVLATGDGNFP